MNNVKITVIDTALRPDMIGRYGQPMEGCTCMTIGQTYLSMAGNKPEGFCEDAWACIGRYALCLAFGVRQLWPGWMKEEGQALLCCNDAFRPVTFLLEAVPA